MVVEAHSKESDKVSEAVNKEETSMTTEVGEVAVADDGSAGETMTSRSATEMLP